MQLFMPDNDKTDEFLQKLAPCIERGELENCMEEAAQVAGKMEIDPPYLFYLATQSWQIGKGGFAYILALAAAHTRALDFIKNIFNQTQP